METSLIGTLYIIMLLVSKKQKENHLDSEQAIVDMK